MLKYQKVFLEVDREWIVIMATQALVKNFLTQSLNIGAESDPNQILGDLVLSGWL